MKKSALLLCTVLLFSSSLLAQFRLQFDAGITWATEDYPRPEPFENFGLFIDPRPGPVFTLTGQYDWDKLSAYGSAGLMYYRVHEGVGPYLSSNRAGILGPSYGQLVRWVGPHFELGVRKDLFHVENWTLWIGAGGGYFFDYTALGHQYPFVAEGDYWIDRSFEYDATFTYLNNQSFLLGTHLMLSRKTKQGNTWNLKVQYHQGINPLIDGEFHYVRSLDTNNETVSEFAFDFVFRQSFLSFTLGYGLNWDKRRM